MDIDHTQLAMIQLLSNNTNIYPIIVGNILGITLR